MLCRVRNNRYPVRTPSVSEGTASVQVIDMLARLAACIPGLHALKGYACARVSLQLACKTRASDFALALTLPVAIVTRKC
jgi:hypothetical protein